MDEMNIILGILNNTDFMHVLWIFVIAFIIHEVEEWNITEFERRNFVNVPATATKQNALIWIGFVCTLAFMWCAAATLPGSPMIAAYVFLPAIALVIGNAFQHIFWTCYFKQYAPGIVTVVLLLIPLGSYAVVRAVQQGYVPLWYAAVLIVLIAVPFTHAVRAGNKMTTMIQGVYNLGDWISKRL
jgi:hypothetical protein